MFNDIRLHETTAQRIYSPSSEEIQKLVQYMQVLFRKDLSQEERTEHRRLISAMTAFWQLSALILAYHYLLIWSLEHKVVPTKDDYQKEENNNTYRMHWYARCAEYLGGAYTVIIESPTRKRAEIIVPNLRHGKPFPRIFDGEVYWAECIIHFSKFIEGASLRGLNIVELLNFLDNNGHKIPFKKIDYF